MSYPEKKDPLLPRSNLRDGIEAAHSDGTLGLTKAERQMLKENQEAIRQEHAATPLGRTGLDGATSLAGAPPEQAPAVLGQPIKPMPEQLEPYRLGLGPNQTGSDSLRIGAP